MMLSTRFRKDRDKRIKYSARMQISRIIDQSYSADTIPYSWALRHQRWRIDYFFISPDLLDKMAAAEIHADVMGSDHCPISLTLDV